jgi:hypothetical protein
MMEQTTLSSVLVDRSGVTLESGVLSAVFTAIASALVFAAAG